MCLKPFFHFIVSFCWWAVTLDGINHLRLLCRFEINLKQKNMGPYVCEFAIVIFSSFPKIFFLFRISSNKLTKYFPSPSIFPLFPLHSFSRPKTKIYDQLANISRPFGLVLQFSWLVKVFCEDKTFSCFCMFCVTPPCK